MPAPKVLVIGLDSCDPTIALRMMDEGRLPQMAALRDAGAQAVTGNPPGLYVGALWASFQTGLTPARHGYYWWKAQVPGTYEIALVPSGAFDAPPFWVTLSEQGKSFAILDLPHSNVTAPLNGVQLAGWGAHDAGLPFHTWPPELQTTIEERFGTHPFGPDCDAVLSTPDEIRSFCDDLHTSIDQRVAMTSYLLEQPWDAVVTAFSESHCVGHQCWHVRDPAHRRHDPEATAALGVDPVEDIYEHLDRAVGELVARTDDDTTVLLLLSHGMAIRSTGEQLLERVLEQLDRAAVSAPKQPVRNTIEAVWDRLPRRVRTLIMEARKKTGVTTASLGLGPTYGDLGTRRAFQLPNSGGNGAIRVNLVGREPNGKVEREDYDAFCEELATELLTLVNVDTGQPAVQRVHRIGDLYDGDRIGELPDLLVEWNLRAPIDAVASPRVGTIRGVDPHVRTGDHRPAGLLLATGPHVRPGLLDRSIPVESFAPTIASLIGTDLPGTDGDAVVELAGELVGR